MEYLSGSLQGSPAISEGSLSPYISDSTEGTTPAESPAMDTMRNPYKGGGSPLFKLFSVESPMAAQQPMDPNLVMKGILHEEALEEMDPLQKSHLAQLCQDTERQLSGKELLDKLEDALTPISGQSDEGDSAMLSAMEPLFPEVNVAPPEEEFDSPVIEEAPKVVIGACPRREPGRNTCRYSGCAACGRTQKSNKKRRHTQLSSTGHEKSASDGARQKTRRNTLDPCLQQAWIDLDGQATQEQSLCQPEDAELGIRTRKKSQKWMDGVNRVLFDSDGEDDAVVSIREFNADLTYNEPKQKIVATHDQILELVCESNDAPQALAIRSAAKYILEQKCLPITLLLQLGAGRQS